ncbi:MAG: M24 family metallopeptidase [Vicinamibacterales bacterium]
MVRPTPAYGHRLAQVRAVLAESGLDALLVTHPPNLRYLVGFDGSMGALILSSTTCTLVVDGRYATSARARLANVDALRVVVVQLAEQSHEETIARVVMSGAPMQNLGVEAAAMTISRFDRLSEALGRAESDAPVPAAAPRLRALERVVERVRVVKDESEVATLREAARLLSTAAVEALSLVHAGRRERDIAADIDAVLRHAGFERPAFETIVASGPNSALPHARPGDRILAPSDGVVLDFGGVYDGYCVDLTRTVQLAPSTDSFGEVFDAVHAAHAVALASVRAGVKASDVDAAARTLLTARGLGEAFVHGTGHGLGLEVHEEPRITRAGLSHPDETLAEGMIFTIEPGAYLPGVGGVRIEDDVLVLREGCEVLTDVPIDQKGRGIQPT